MPKPTRNFLNLDDVPSPKKDSEFWSVITSDKFKACINFLLINEVRKYDPSVINDYASSVQLAKIKALQEILDFPNALIESGNESPDQSDDIPDKYPTPKK